MEKFTYAFSLTLFAGLATAFGSLISLTVKKVSTRLLSFSLGFSAGVMLYVSMIDIYSEVLDILIPELGAKQGYFVAIVSFFCGMFLIAIIEKLVPEAQSPHDLGMEKKVNSNISKSKLMRLGMITAIIVTIHNFPEGIATFISAYYDPSIALPIAFAIALHNIPEGISVSLPIYFATGSKSKAFFYSFLCGMAEPLGALAGFFILMPFITDVLLGVIFGCVAGIMVYISLDELLPAAREYGESHIAMSGLISGMIVMAVSILLLG